ncbi:unnamed protein product, partial [Rotaria magnacalcarata]
MIIPTANDEFKFDMYVYCTLSNGSKYDFTNPCSSSSYTAHILDNLDKWTIKKRAYLRWEIDHYHFETASAKLLLILKKYMLYYTHQWRKTAKAYRELLTIADPLTVDDTILCDLFIQYNEKLYGRRPADTDEFFIVREKGHDSIIINRHDFFKLDRGERFSYLYRTALSISCDNDVLVGLEYICTQGPLWLSDYIINNWIDIQNEKLKQRQLQLPCLCAEVELYNYCLFPELPQIPTRRILQFITRAVNFHKMQLVCKRWHTILGQESFWRDLFISHYKDHSETLNNATSWKRLYFERLNEENIERKNKFGYFVDATIKVRQYTANDVLKLWEDLTHQDQIVDPTIMSKIDFILSSSIYSHLGHTSNHYSAKLIAAGVEDYHSQTTIVLNLEMGEYGKISRFSDYMEILSVQCHSNSGIAHSLKFSGPALFGFYMRGREYTHCR